jgi:hypothetical protein
MMRTGKLMRLFYTSILLFISFGSASAQTAKYTFNPAKPPLLDDFKGNVVSIPTSDLSTDMGETTWKTSTDVISGDSSAKLKAHTDYTYHARRSWHWVISQPPIHFAENQDYDVRTTTGYSKDQKSSIEKTMSLGFDASGAFAGLKLSTQSKEELKVTASTEMQWHAEVVEDKKVTFHADTTYVTWSLLDSLVIDMNSTTSDYLILFGGAPKLISQSSGRAEKTLDNVIMIYSDKKADASGQVNREAATNLAAPSSGANVRSGTGITISPVLPAR